MDAVKNFFTKMSKENKFVLAFCVIVILCTLYRDCVLCKYVPKLDGFKMSKEGFRTGNTSNIKQLEQKYIDAKKNYERELTLRTNRLKNTDRRLMSLKTKMDNAKKALDAAKKKEGFTGSMMDSVLSVMNPIKKKEGFVSNMMDSVLSVMNPIKKKEGFQSGEDGEREGFGVSRPSMVLFYAPWCPHCKSMMGDWEKLQNEVGSDVEVVKVNCDEKPEMAEQYDVKGFPTIILFKEGKKVHFEGSRNLDNFLEFLRSN
jgi:protein disulfide-isomerase-like protein